MPSDNGYKLVKLPNGSQCVRSLAYGETMHPGLGPAAEAESLYVRQLKLRERLHRHTGEFVVWDIGLGAAANAITVMRATRDLPCPFRVVSFDDTSEPIAFALAHKESLGYFDRYEAPVRTLLDHRCVTFRDGDRPVHWELHLADFPNLLKSWTSTVSLSGANTLKRELQPASPHAVQFDAFSPARNPAMWTLPLFANLFQVLDPQRPCALATYSRSTMVRVTLLLAGFFVGRGQAMDRKEETTVAANTPELIDAPLDRQWLERVRRSKSAEPLVESIYRQAPLSPQHWEELRAHRQFEQKETK